MKLLRPLALSLSILAASLADAKTHLIAIKLREAIEISPQEDRNLSMLHRITFDDESLDWTAHEDFSIGDTFAIKLGDVGTVEITIESVEQSDEHISITGVFEGGLGWAQILFIDEKLCVMLSDYQDREIYHIVYNEIERCYTLRVISSTST